MRRRNDGRRLGYASRPEMEARGWSLWVRGVRPSPTLCAADRTISACVRRGDEIRETGCIRGRVTTFSLAEAHACFPRAV